MAPAPGRAGGLRDWATGLGTAALLVAILYVPSYRQLAGKIMALDLEPFHHWDFFAMGPAVGYATGGALGTEVYSQYGVGWPVLLAAIAPAIPLGYGNALHVANIYILTYFLGIYLFLRLWLGEGAWAAAGSLATAYMLMYESAMPGVGVWMHPNSTALRSPTDVWFFLGMWLHLRSGRPRWAAFMGAAAGLGIVFATDTGLLLVATMVAYLARPKPGEPGPGGPGVRRGRGAIGLAVGPAVAAIAALGGLAIASRGTILRPEFWRGWLEAITDYGGGIGALPMADLTDRPTLVLFLVMVGTYLATLGVLAVALLHGRADRGRVLAGGLAIYGLARMVYFVNRSHPYNFPHASAPFCLIATWATRLAWRRASGGVPGRGLAPGIAIVLALALLAANPNFRGFPSLAREIVRGRPEAGLRLMPDVCGLPPGSRPTVEEFAAVTSRLASLKSRGASVAVLDMADTMDYLASGCAPPARYIPLLPGLLRRDQLERAEARLLAEKVDWIFSSLPAPGRDQDESPHGDVFRVFSELLRRHYVPVDRIGRFTIWRRASAGPGSARRARSEGGPGSRTVP